jgi:hypothetical protein
VAVVRESLTSLKHGTVHVQFCGVDRAGHPGTRLGDALGHPGARLGGDFPVLKIHVLKEHDVAAPLLSSKVATPAPCCAVRQHLYAK